MSELWLAGAWLLVFLLCAGDGGRRSRGFLSDRPGDTLSEMASALTDQPKLDFALAEGRALRDRLMQVAADAREGLLAKARAAAVELATRDPFRECDADRVYARLEADGERVSLLGNAAGSIFKTREWEFTGRRKQSRRVSNHARDIRIWRLR